MKKAGKTLTKIAALTLILCLITGAAPLTAFAEETRYTVSYDTFGIGEPIAPTLSGRSDYDFDRIGNALNAVPVTTDEHYAALGKWYLDRELTQRASYTTVLTCDTTLYYKWVGPKEVIETVSLDINPTISSNLRDRAATTVNSGQSSLYNVSYAEWHGLNYEDTFIPGHAYHCELMLHTQEDANDEPLAFFKGHKSWDTETVSLNLPDSCANARVVAHNAVSLRLTFIYTMPMTPVITTKELPKGHLDLDYHAQLAATNHDGGTVNWSASGLPNGLTVTEDGVVSGIPTQSGNFTVVVQAENSYGVSTAQLPLTVSETYGIFVRSVSGTDHPLQVRQTDTIAMITRRLLDEQLISPNREVFLTNRDGKLLRAERTLADYGIFNDGLIEINYSVTTYPVYVIDGGADVSEAAYGQLVLLTPDAAAYGTYFHGWEVVSGSAVITDNCFEMPDGPVTVRAVFRSKISFYAALTEESKQACFGLAHTISGSLEDDNCNPVTDGPSELTITLCNDPNDDPDAAEYTVQVTNGAFELTIPSVDNYYQLIMIRSEETERYCELFQISSFDIYTIYVWLNSDNMKKEYLSGESLDVSNGKICIYKTNSSEIMEIPVTADMVSGFDSSKTGRQHLSVRNDYNDEVLEYFVDVKKEYREYYVYFETFGICDPPAPMKSVYSDWKYTTVIPWDALAYYPEYSNEKYILLGWTLNPDGTGDPLLDNIEMESDITLYAIWSEPQEILDTIRFDFAYPESGTAVPGSYIFYEDDPEATTDATLEEIGISLAYPWRDKVVINHAEWSSIDWENLDWDAVDWEHGGIEAMMRSTFDAGETYYLDLFLSVPENAQCVFKGFLSTEYIEDENGNWRLDTSNAPTVWFGSENVTACIVNYHETFMHIRYAYTVREAEPVCLGDANGDNKVDIRDVTAIQRHLAESELLDEAHILAADANRDGEVGIADATYLQMFLAEQLDSSPIGTLL